MPEHSANLALIRKLRLRAPLADDDAAAIAAIPISRRDHAPNVYLVREGAVLGVRCMFIASGIAFRQKLTTEGARQIVSLQMPGDFLDLQHLFLKRADHSVQALTKLDVIEIDRATLRKLILERPAIGHAMWVDALVDASISREWLLNVGRRNARTKVAHLLCEFSIRMRAVGSSQGQSYELPMTQEQVGDALGLTSVHVNRTLMSLANDGIIDRDNRRIAFADWQLVKSVADFDPRYLHLDETVLTGIGSGDVQAM